MLSAGFVAEVRQLQSRGDLTERHPSMRAVGYRQLWRYCQGECSLTEASQQAVIATAQLAKRQMTWLRREQGTIALNAAAVGQAAVIGGQIQQALAHDRPGAQ
jgi:tRNA dimethylallyltransferase